MPRIFSGSASSSWKSSSSLLALLEVAIKIIMLAPKRALTWDAISVNMVVDCGWDSPTEFDENMRFF